MESSAIHRHTLQEELVLWSFQVPVHDWIQMSLNVNTLPPCISPLPITSLRPLYLRYVHSLPLCLSGNPPSVVVVTRITETMQEGVQVMWMEPEVTNGVILSYTVEVKLLSKDGHTLYADSYIVMVGGMCLLENRHNTAAKHLFPSTLLVHATVSWLAKWFRVSHSHISMFVLHVCITYSLHSKHLSTLIRQVIGISYTCALWWLHCTIHTYLVLHIVSDSVQS